MDASSTHTEQPRCWSCGTDLHEKNVAVRLPNKGYVPCCMKCWEELPIAYRLDLALKFERRLREHETSVQEHQHSAAAVELMQQATELTNLIISWYPCNDWADRMRSEERN